MSARRFETDLSWAWTYGDHFLLMTYITTSLDGHEREGTMLLLPYVAGAEAELLVARNNATITIPILVDTNYLAASLTVSVI